MTGSALALPLFAAGGASAAEAGTWKAVADCETGGLWSANYGDGRYGGLRLTQTAWEAYGGTAHAPRADLATRAQQIAVADKILADQGTRPWLTCAPIAGLTAPEGSGVENPGVPATPTPSPSTSAPETDPEDSATPAPGGTPSGSTAPGATPSPAKPSSGTSASPRPDADGQDAPAKGKHRGSPAPEGDASTSPGPGSTDEQRDGGGHASRGELPARDGIPSGTGGAGPSAEPSTDPAEHAGGAEDGTYTVRPGDNLWAIADAHEVRGGWPALYEANKGVVGGDPDLILPGQSLDLDGAEG
ncbi:transglycosylase family protein [Streptomyces sp. NPDC001941]|uniref:LysM peptidoglycan-binding domain-containing protein n=1 Tax=Streptomyces sp. NPDC001941 TaxID=3154659 RepID=UPI0033236423